MLCAQRKCSCPPSPTHPSAKYWLLNCSVLVAETTGRGREEPPGPGKRETRRRLDGEGEPGVYLYAIRDVEKENGRNYAVAAGK